MRYVWLGEQLSSLFSLSFCWLSGAWQNDIRELIWSCLLNQQFLNIADTLFQERQIKSWDFIQRACIKLMKVLISLQCRHPYSFGDESVLPAILDFCLNNIINPEPPLSSFEQFLIQCMILVKSVMECKEYKPTLTGRVIDGSGDSLEQRKKQISQIVADMLAAILPNDRVVLLCNILVRR